MRYGITKRGLLTKAGALGVAGLLFTGSVAGTSAQDATPVVEENRGPFWATIEAGVCGEELGETAFDLGLMELDEPGDDVEVQGFQISPPVTWKEETIDQELDDLLDDERQAIVVRDQSADGDPLACAQLGGTVRDDQLAVGLRPLNGSGFYGVAVLEVDEGAPIVGDDQTRVTVYVFQDQGPAGPVGIEQQPDEETAVPEPEITGTPAD